MLTVSDFPRFSQKSPGRASLIWDRAFQPGGHKSFSKDKMESSQLLASPYLLESSPCVAKAFAALCIMAEPCSLCRCPSSWCLEMRHPGILTRRRNRGGLRHSAAGNSYPTIFRWPLNSLLWIAFERSIFLPPTPIPRLQLQRGGKYPTFYVYLPNFPGDSYWDLKILYSILGNTGQADCKGCFLLMSKWAPTLPSLSCG